MCRALVIAGLALLGVACSALMACIAGWTGHAVTWAAAPFALFVLALSVLWLGSRLRTRRDPRAWYVVVGPPKSGKSSLLERVAELVPTPLDPRARLPVRRCELWENETATWLEAQDDDSAWLELLELLRGQGSARVAGLLVMVSTADILNTAPHDFDAIASRLRRRLMEVCHTLGVGLPVYLLCSQCDLLPSFDAMFEGLSLEERDQTLGFALLGEHSSVGSDFTRHFDRLAESLRRAAIVRIAARRGLHERTRAYAFPQQFRSMREPLTGLVERLFEPRVRAPTPLLRGVYFVSSVDSVRATGELSGVRTGPYFIRDLFAHTLRAQRVGLGEGRAYPLLRTLLRANAARTCRRAPYP